MCSKMACRVDGEKPTMILSASPTSSFGYSEKRKINYSGIDSKISSAGNSKLGKYIAKLLDEISIVDDTNENLEMKNINLLPEKSWGDIQMKMEVCC